jgi:hypothetical protein
MKASKTGILKKKAGPTSDVLQEEAKKMEEKLAELRQFMAKEKEKRDTVSVQKDGSRWRSAASNKPLKNYSNFVLSYKPRPGSTSKKEPVQKKKEEFVPTSALLGMEENKAANDNIKKALSQQAETSNEVKEFLKSCGMDKYSEILLSNGIDDMEILLELTEDHLANLSIPLGHRLKIMKKIREIRTMTGTYSNNIKPSSAVKLGKSDTMGELEPLPYEGERAAASNTQNTQNTQSSSGNLLDGEYNEAESYNMFKEALENFRKAGSAIQTKALTKSGESESESKSDLKKVRFTDPITEDMLQNPTENKKKSNWLLDEQSDWNPTKAVIADTREEGSTTNASIKILGENKRSCWECYKLFSKEAGIEMNQKEFCGQECVQKYKKNRSINCRCGNSFMKEEGLFRSGEWVCSEKCAPAQSDLPITNTTIPPQSELFEDEDEEDCIKVDPIGGDPIVIPPKPQSSRSSRSRPQSRSQSSQSSRISQPANPPAPSGPKLSDLLIPSTTKSTINESIFSSFKEDIPNLPREVPTSIAEVLPIHSPLLQYPDALPRDSLEVEVEDYKPYKPSVRSELSSTPKKMSARNTPIKESIDKLEGW